jgi:hypothetical protein
MRTTLSVSAATKAKAKVASSLIRTGWLTVTGVTTKRTKISASSTVLETSADRTIDGRRRSEAPEFSADLMT